MQNDMRPAQYRYWEQLVKHMAHDTTLFFNGTFVYPRQFEIHLPGSHLKPCDLNCPHCAGKYFKKDLGTWEMDGLELLNRLQGAIPYHIYGGAYTEPLLNPYFMSFLHMTKRYGNHFGIHTHGVLLSQLEECHGWLTELNRISTDNTDYLSVSIDAGFPWSWAKTKGEKNEDLYNRIIKGLQRAVEIRDKAGRGHAIRLCYLISPHSDSPENFTSIVSVAKELRLDSLRFSIPFACYNQPFEKVREYKESTEIPMADIYLEGLAQHLSTSQEEKPYIFYTGPEFTDIDKFNFRRCVYGYYQITYGADGYFYKCSTTATPTMSFCRLGRATSNLDNFHHILAMNQNPDWDASICFSKGARCNRMGLEINRIYSELQTPLTMETRTKL